MARIPLLCIVWLLAIVALAAGPRTAAEEPPIKSAPAEKPWFVDDEKFFGDFMEQLTQLAKNGKCLSREKLAKKLESGKNAKVALAKPTKTELTPNEVYQRLLPSVFIIGSVQKSKHKDKEKEKDKGKEQKDNDKKEGDWQEGLYATAWVAASNGILVTNWHVFDDLEEGEVFGAVDYQGNVYPMTDFLGGDKVADVAIIKIAARGLKPLPVSDSYPLVGSWVGVLGHPGDNYYVFTQGFVTRYSTNKNDDGKREHWMGLSAEYAGGSSGSPVVDKCGNVVGMAALTLTIDGNSGGVTPDRHRSSLSKEPPIKAPPPHEKPEGKEVPKPGSAVQMVLKMAVPGPVILKSFGK